jgi:hypothetical protein
VGQPPEVLFNIAIPSGWEALASPAVGQDTVVFGLAKVASDEGIVAGIAAEPDFAIHLGHSDIVADSAFSVRDFNAPITDPTWPMKPYDATNAPNGYRLDADSGAITFSQRDAAKRIVVTYDYRYTAAAGQDAVGGPVTEYHTLPRLVKWEFPAVGINVGVPILASDRVLVVRAGGGPYPDPHDGVAQPLWIDRPAGVPAVIYLPFPWKDIDFDVYVDDVLLTGGPFICDYKRDASGTPVPSLQRIVSSPVIAGNTVFVDAVTYQQPSERVILCLQLDPAEGTELDLTTKATWGVDFRQFKYNDDMAIDPDNRGNGNGSYDLLGVTPFSTVPSFVASPALAGDKLLLASCRTDGTNWYWSLNALSGELGHLGDGSRLLQLRRDGSAQAEWHSTVQRTALGGGPSIRTDRQPFAGPVSAQALASVGREGNLLVTDTQNNRLVEMDRAGKVLWRMDKAFGDAFTDSFGLLAKGEPTSISRPSDAFRAETPERNASNALTGLRSEVTFIADSGNYRAVALQNHFNPAANAYSLPAPDLLWRTDPTQTVYQAVDRSSGGSVILDSTTHLPSFRKQKVAGDYQYVSVQPVTLKQFDPPGVVSNGRIRWNNAASLPEFDFAVAAVDNYALDKFPDDRLKIFESGPGASAALMNRAGQIFAACSGFYLDPAAANAPDPSDSTLTAIKWGRPYDRVFTQIESVEVSRVSENYPAAGWATFYLTVAGTVARNQFDASTAPPTSPFGPGVYPITLMIYLGSSPADAGDYNSATNPLRFDGRPYLSVAPQIASYNAGNPFGLPIWFDQAKYGSYMTTFANAASGFGPPNQYPLQYTGTAGSYAYFRPSSATLCSNGHTYIIVNSHDQKQEVFEWEPALEALGAAPDLAMKNICPRPQTYSDGHPAFFGGAGGLTRPSTLGRDY